MFRYSTAYINILSFVISIIIFFTTNIFFFNDTIFKSKNILEVNVQVESSNIKINPEEDEKKDTIEDVKEETKEDWYLEIPCINLRTDIKEGTTKEIMDNYIGHFEETKIEDGNIGLAAHNRGYKNNYFERLKELKEGDKIYYHHSNYKKEYVVEKHIINGYFVMA